LTSNSRKWRIVLDVLTALAGLTAMVIILVVSNTELQGIFKVIAFAIAFMLLTFAGLTQAIIDSKNRQAKRAKPQSDPS